VIAAVNGWAVAAGLETALLADIRIAAENAVFGALERRWNIVAGDGMTVRLPLAVGYSRAMEMIITGRAVDAEEAQRIGLANEVVPEGRSLQRALELAQEIAALPQGAIRTDKETMVRNVGRTLEEQLRQEAEATYSMFMRRDSHAIGASAFKQGARTRVAEPRALSTLRPRASASGFSIIIVSICSSLAPELLQRRDDLLEQQGHAPALGHPRRLELLDHLRWVPVEPGSDRDVEVLGEEHLLLVAALQQLGGGGVALCPRQEDVEP